MTEPRDARQPTPGRQRYSRQGAAIDALLAETPGFVTAQDLHAALRRQGDGTGLTTVYRHLNLLAAGGRVDVIHREDGEARYRLCGPVDSEGGAAAHHHHLVCRVCGTAVEVEDPAVEAWADRVAAQAGFTEVTHTLEVFGRCPKHPADA